MLYDFFVTALNDHKQITEMDHKHENKQIPKVEAKREPKLDDENLDCDDFEDVEKSSMTKDSVNPPSIKIPATPHSVSSLPPIMPPSVSPPLIPASESIVVGANQTECIAKSEKVEKVDAKIVKGEDQEKAKCIEETNIISSATTEMVMQSQDAPTEADYYGLKTKLALAEQRMAMEKEMAAARLENQQMMIKMKEEMMKNFTQMQMQTYEMKIEHLNSMTTLKIEAAVKEQARVFAEKELASLKKKVPVKRDAWFCIKCAREKKIKECATCKDSPGCVEWMNISVEQHL